MAAILDMTISNELLEKLIDSEYELMCNAQSIDEAREHFFLMSDLIQQRSAEAIKETEIRVLLH